MRKQFVYNTFSSLHVDFLWRLVHHSPSVLFYHGVADDPDPVIETESIAAKDFVRQMTYLKHHYHVISVREFEERFITNKWEGNEVLLTFDDGYKNMLSTALPVLENFQFPFVLFYTTNNISRGELFATTVNRLVVLVSSLHQLVLPSCQINTELTAQNRTSVAECISKQLKNRPLNEVQAIVAELTSLISQDEMESLRERYSSINPMNWDEAKQISSSPLCTIGSHCVDHICCHANQNMEEVTRQICESKRVIENQIGMSCDYFSYPNGSFTGHSNKVVSEVGYRLGFSTKRMPVNALTRWNIPRFYVPYDYSRFVYSLVSYPK